MSPFKKVLKTFILQSLLGCCLFSHLHAQIAVECRHVPLYPPDALNGVNTVDLLLINRHLLGDAVLTNPAQILAADVNKSYSLSTFDLVLIRRLILGNSDTLTKSPIWRFKSARIGTASGGQFDRDFPDIDPAMLGQPGYALGDFIAIKTGDVNRDNTLDCDAPPEKMQGEPMAFALPAQALAPGEVVILPVYITGKSPLVGFQAAFRFDTAHLQCIQASAGDIDGFSAENFGLTKADVGEIRVSWISGDEISFFTREKSVLFYLAFRARAAIPDVSQALALDTAALDCFGVESDLTLHPIQSISPAPANPVESVVGLSGATVPNPVEGAFELVLQSESTAPLRLGIYGPFGRRLYYKEISTVEKTVHIAVPEAAEWATGIYSWRVAQNNNKIMGKFVKMPR